MTLQQLNDLDEQELALLLIIVNHIDPPCLPKMEFEARHLTWFKHDMLVRKILGVFPKLNPDGHAIYSSLLAKLGVQHEIKQQAPQAPPAPLPETSSVNPVTSSAEPTTGSI